jgi:hypothetical protein
MWKMSHMPIMNADCWHLCFRALFGAAWELETIKDDIAFLRRNPELMFMRYGQDTYQFHCAKRKGACLAYGDAMELFGNKCIPALFAANPTIGVDWYAVDSRQ